MKMTGVILMLILGLLNAAAVFGQPEKGAGVRPNVTNQKRVALVIGNADYQKTSRLQNPVNDARDVAAALRELGFEVFAGENESADGMKRLVNTFGQRLKASGGVGLFFI